MERYEELVIEIMEFDGAEIISASNPDDAVEEFPVGGQGE